MITMKVKDFYLCEHCRKEYQRAHACLKHESYCKKNPDMKSPSQEYKILDNKKELK